MKIGFQNIEKNRENIFCFWDNYTWIGCLKLPLLGGEYWSSKVNMLRSSIKILSITKRVFSNSFAFTAIDKYGKGGAVKISKVFGVPNNDAYGRFLWKGTF